MGHSIASMGGGHEMPVGRATWHIDQSLLCQERCLLEKPYLMRAIPPDKHDTQKNLTSRSIKYNQTIATHTGLDSGCKGIFLQH